MVELRCHDVYTKGLGALGELLGYSAAFPKYGAATDCRWRGVFGNSREVLHLSARSSTIRRMRSMRMASARRTISTSRAVSPNSALWIYRTRPDRYASGALGSRWSAGTLARLWSFVGMP